MSVELLRRCAAKMRENAEAARSVYAEHHPLAGQPVPWFDSVDAYSFDDSDGPHIASWHPDVALAVADAIDRFLSGHREITSGRWSDAHTTADDFHFGPPTHYEGSPNCTPACVEEFNLCSGCGTTECKEIRYWVPIARAYLGEDS